MTGLGGLTCRKSCGKAALVAPHLRPGQGRWAPAPLARAALQRPARGTPPSAQALGLATSRHRKARASSGPWPPSSAIWLRAGPRDRCRHHLRGRRREAPGSGSCTPPRRRSYCRCRGTRRTRTGYTGPQRGRSTSGPPSPRRSRGRWAAGTAQGRLRGQKGERHQAAGAAQQSPADKGPPSPLPRTSEPGPSQLREHVYTLTWPLGQRLLKARTY